MAALALALALPLVACGEEDSATFSVDASRAAAATSEQGTARMTMTMRMSGLGLPGEMEVTADGVTALDEPRADITLDFGNLLSLLGPGGGDGKVRILFDGSQLYVDPPAIEGLALPNDGGWLALDLGRIVEVLGIDPDAAGALFTVDAASQLRVLREAGGLEEKGTEEIDGVETTHLAGAYSVEDVIAALPPARQERVREALADIERLAPGSLQTDQKIPVELWVGEDAIVRRMRTEVALPAQPGLGAGRMSMTYELSDFGTPLDTSRPDGAVDVTDRLVDLFEGYTGAVAGAA